MIFTFPFTVTIIYIAKTVFEKKSILFALEILLDFLQNRDVFVRCYSYS